MKQYIILALITIFSFAGTTVSAQNTSENRQENVESAKVAFLTDKMELTPEQSQKFWPLYNEYQSKRRELTKSYRSGYRRDVDELSEQEAKARIERMFDTREQELQLEKEYVTKFQRVITNKQLVKFYRSEREFTKLLLKRLDARRANN
ncbi:Spy/CpxP family protein refolding chaperone [Pontibacter vulgaris]|uniref:Spy/CpxP family protein refolding chaperone n=1 Tax=Pontibacter vulgaris TaxID=2905679 RepID=UPI001FA76EBB|nr:Spy/CpxP family protein refolding chaperone [Pontibacter vulgaris]